MRPNKWQYKGFDPDIKQKLVTAAINHAVNVRSNDGFCPLCGNQKLRMYYHSWVKPKGLEHIRRGSLWVWCYSCLCWVSKGNMDMAKYLNLSDPFERMNTSDFGIMEEQDDWIEQLNTLWEEQEVYFR